MPDGYENENIEQQYQRSLLVSVYHAFRVYMYRRRLVDESESDCSDEAGQKLDGAKVYALASLKLMDAELHYRDINEELRDIALALLEASPEALNSLWKRFNKKANDLRSVHKLRRIPK